jgi:hypothetical protein
VLRHGPSCFLGHVMARGSRKGNTPRAFPEEADKLSDVKVSGSDPSDYDLTDEISNKPEVDEAAPAPEVEAEPILEEPAPVETPETDEVPAEEVPAEEVAETPAAEVDEFPADLLETASHYGVSAEEAREYGSAASLKRALVQLDRQASRLTRDQWSQLGKQQQAPEHSPAPQTETQKLQSDFDKLKVELNADDYDPKLVESMNAFAERINQLSERNSQHEQVLRAQQQQAEQYTSHQQAEAFARLGQEVDSFVNTLGDEYSGKFGKGPINGLRPGSPEEAARNELLTEMESLRFSDAQQYRKPQPNSQLLQRALASLYPDEIKTTVRKELTRQVKEQRSQALHRPAGRQHAPLSGKEKAIARVRDWQKTNNISTAEDSEVLAEL